jgi:hypothetical protein
VLICHQDLPLFLPKADAQPVAPRRLLALLFLLSALSDRILLFPSRCFGRAGVLGCDPLNGREDAIHDDI